MDEMARAMAEFRRNLRLEGFSERDALHLTGVYLTALLTGALGAQESA